MRFLVLLLVVACAHPRPTDFAEARRGFKTKLLRPGPSPQTAVPLVLAPDADEITYRSGGLALRAWISKPTAGPRRPAIVYVHGASAFRVDHWTGMQALRDAGYIVMMPILRGENGSPGAFTLFYDEVDDIVAAAEALAARSEVDPARIFVAGHSNGGTLAILAAMTSTRFRGAAALSGIVDTSGIRGTPPDVPFDQTDPEEYRMRSAIAWPGSFKCPVRLYYGAEEHGAGASFEELAQAARARGRDVAAVRVAGDHDTMKLAAIPLVLAQFAR